MTGRDAGRTVNDYCFAHAASEYVSDKTGLEEELLVLLHIQFLGRVLLSPFILNLNQFLPSLLHQRLGDIVCFQFFVH